MFNLFNWTLISKSVTRGLHTNYPHIYELQKNNKKKIIRVYFYFIFLNLFYLFYFLFYFLFFIIFIYLFIFKFC